MTNKLALKNLNELEWVNGKIYANTYQFQKDVVVIINPKTGAVEGVVDFSGLKSMIGDATKSVGLTIIPTKIITSQNTVFRINSTLFIPYKIIIYRKKTNADTAPFLSINLGLSRNTKDNAFLEKIPKFTESK